MTTVQRMICPSCKYSTATKADGTFVEHTRNGQRIRAGAKRDGRRCGKSGKRAVR